MVKVPGGCWNPPLALQGVLVSSLLLRRTGSAFSGKPECRCPAQKGCTCVRQRRSHPLGTIGRVRDLGGLPPRAGETIGPRRQRCPDEKLRSGPQNWSKQNPAKQESFLEPSSAGLSRPGWPPTQTKSASSLQSAHLPAAPHRQYSLAAPLGSAS